MKELVGPMNGYQKQFYEAERQMAKQMVQTWLSDSAPLPILTILIPESRKLCYAACETKYSGSGVLV